jgi:hypothetical protein
MPSGDVYHVSIKNDAGEYEDLGIMSSREALRYSWEHGHRAIKLVKVGNDGN